MVLLLIIIYLFLSNQHLKNETTPVNRKTSYKGYKDLAVIWRGCHDVKPQTSLSYLLKYGKNNYLQVSIQS